MKLALLMSCAVSRILVVACLITACKGMSGKDGVALVGVGNASHGSFARGGIIGKGFHPIEARARTKGAVMRDGVSMKKLGEASPGMRPEGVHRLDYIDPAPIVLWSGSTPTAMYYRVQSDSHARRMVQQIARLDESKNGGFPIKIEAQRAPGAGDRDPIDILDPQGILAADVNGDGTDELVMMRKLGGADVQGLHGPLFRYPNPVAGPDAHYEPSLSHRVKLAGREVLYLLYNRTPRGPGDPNLLLRVDASGITRVPLRDLGNWRILAVGALQRSGSQDIDELLVHLEDGEQDTALARFRPDGTSIAPPRRLYTKIPSGAMFRFVPHSDRAVLASRKSVLVLSPDRPVNWIRAIDVAAHVQSDEIWIYETVDLATDPKVIVQVDDRPAFYLVQGSLGGR